MTPLSKTLVAAAALAAMATSAFSQAPWEFNQGMAYMYSGSGKMTAMAIASTSKNHEAMMKDAKKVPDNTVFFMADNCSQPPERWIRPATSIGPDPICIIWEQ